MVNNVSFCSFNSKQQNNLRLPAFGNAAERTLKQIGYDTFVPVIREVNKSGEIIQELPGDLGKGGVMGHIKKIRDRFLFQTERSGEVLSEHSINEDGIITGELARDCTSSIYGSLEQVAQQDKNNSPVHNFFRAVADSRKSTPKQ